MLENFAVSGAVPITRQDIAEMLHASITDLKNAITNSALTAAQTDDPSAAALTATGSTSSIIHRYASWKWNGTLHPVEYGFKFPV